MSSKPQTLAYARQDPAHVLAPGLFQIQTSKKRNALDIDYQLNDSERLRFTGFQQLGIDDLRVLQALAAMATNHKTRVGADAKSDLGQALRKGLVLNDVAASEDALAVKCTLVRLLTEIGYGVSGQNRERVDKSLFRLANVTIKVTQEQREWVSHLLSYVVDKTGDGLLHIALNSRITQAIIGARRYVRIDMDEVRALRSDHARLIYQRLCAIVDAGTRRAINEDTLMSYVWPNVADKSTTRRKRLWCVRRAMREIAATGGWTVEPRNKPGQVIIGRKGIPSTKPVFNTARKTAREPLALAA